MNIKAMNIFKSVQQFFVFSNFIEEKNWKIEKQLLRDRVLVYREWFYFNQFKNQFYQQKVSIWELKEEEIITWFDTLNLLRRIFTEVIRKIATNNDISIIMEYPLVNGNYMRSDYLIIYDRLIVVLEFGMFNQDEKRSEERYTKKLQESINYRQIIANQVDDEIVVHNYVMIYKPEYDRIRNAYITENITYNNLESFKLSRYLIRCINKQESQSALKQLELMEMTNN
ncbi:MAG: hypothetical protein RBT45_00005 [Acholeplasmataceae bacterium]|jgi:hypothetical protein|nr:hypothetical protein [Acholeplasmataceae bacterium]